MADYIYKEGKEWSITCNWSLMTTHKIPPQSKMVDYIDKKEKSGLNVCPRLLTYASYVYAKLQIRMTSE